MRSSGDRRCALLKRFNEYICDSIKSVELGDGGVVGVRKQANVTVSGLRFQLAAKFGNDNDRSDSLAGSLLRRPRSARPEPRIHLISRLHARDEG
jgi:hypothetical protein